jgi:hypothetical protein
MQYNYTQTLKKITTQNRISIIAKGLIFLFLLYYIYFSFGKNHDILGSIAFSFSHIIDKTSFHGIILMFILTIVNWSLEARKWQLLISKIEKVDFMQAIKGVLAGLSLGFFTPHSIGDYAGRILLLKSEGRFNAIGAVLLGRFAQFFCTLVFGTVGLFYFLLLYSGKFNLQMGYFSFIYGLSLLIVGGVLFQRKKVIQVIKKSSKNVLTQFYKIITCYSRSEIFKIIQISVLRYLTFLFQFVWLLYIIEVDLNLFILFAGVTWIYLSKSIIPAFNFLSDLGIREFSALLFFSLFDVNTATIVSASLFIWFINIFLPTITGAYFIFKFRFFAKV